MSLLAHQSLIVKRSVSSTGATYNTYNNRKISDYNLILIKLYDNANEDTVCRATMLVAANEFVSGKGFYLYGFHGATGSAASEYSVCTLFVWPQSDTSIGMNVGGSAMLTGVAIEGLRIRP